MATSFGRYRFPVGKDPTIAISFDRIFHVRLVFVRSDYLYFGL